MSVSKILKRVTEKKLEVVGFEKVDIKASGIWIFQRMIENKKQELYIQKAQHYAGIELYFKDMFYHVTDIVDVVHVFSPKLVQMIRQSGTDFIEYENENELECIVTEFTDVIIKEVLPLYEIIIRPDQYPTIELERELYEHVRMYADRCIGRYNLKYEREIVKIKECVKELERLVDEQRNLTGNEFDEFLLCLSAYYGELTRQAHKGKWREEEEPHLYVLEFIDENVDRRSMGATMPLSPLGAIFSYWDKPEIYQNKITANYNHLLWGIGLQEMYG